MKNFCIEKILKVIHWNNKLFSFYATKNQKLRLKNGQFLIIGLNINKYYTLIIRAYSIVNPNHSNYVEFFSIIIEKGIFTAKLKTIQSGDYILISKKSNGTLILDTIKTGKVLYFIASGTGLAPFISLIQDPILYKRFNQIMLMHGVSYINELSYKNFITKKLFYNEYIKNKLKQHLIYYPTITRENYITKGRINELIIKGKLFKDLILPYINCNFDKFMLCGNKNMLKEMSEYLKKIGLKNKNTKDFVMEYAFIIKQNWKSKHKI